ncbi:MAG: Flagellar FliJ protein [Syntrophorhabdus sp. PtaB.Bin184]|jgi:flagellar export protein FliJ|nr:MAG: Flagellar FliJ protein [Syntrophorhabdus sp. PtaB.Bin184]
MDRKRIDRIIEIKEKLRKDKEREVEEAAVKMAAIRAEINAVDGLIDDNYAKLSARSISGNDFAVIKDYLDYLDVQKSSLLCEKASMQETIDLLQHELYEYARELKMLGKLEDKINRAFRKSENRREQKLLDEMALRLEDKRM